MEMPAAFTLDCRDLMLPATGEMQVMCRTERTAVILWRCLPGVRMSCLPKENSPSPALLVHPLLQHWMELKTLCTS